MDDELRTLLLDGNPPVDDLDRARDSISRRVHRGRVVRRVGAVVATAVVVGVAAVGLSALQLPSSQPIIGQPSDQPAPAESDGVREVPTTMDECFDGQVEPAVTDWLNEWTTGIKDLTEDGRCVLQGKLGPEPTFDTSKLGEQQTIDLATDTASASVVSRTADGYPVIDLGRLSPPPTPNDAQDPEPEQLYAYWAGIRLGLTNDGLGIGGQVPGESPGGVIGLQSGEFRTIRLVVEPDTAVVAIELDGERLRWTRPVSRFASISLTRTEATNADTVTIRQFAPDGTTLVTHDDVEVDSRTDPEQPVPTDDGSTDDNLEPLVEGEQPTSQEQPQGMKPLVAVAIIVAFVVAVAAVGLHMRRREADGSLDAGPSSVSQPGLRRFFDFGPGGWSEDGKNQPPKE